MRFMAIDTLLTSRSAGCALLAIVCSLAAFPCNATDINWVGSVNGNWNEPSKWSPAQVPSTNDTAIITNAGTYTVTLNVNPVIDGLVLGGTSGIQTVAISGRTLTLNEEATVGTNGAIYFNGGQLAGSGQYELEGVMSWISGELASNASLHVASGGQCDIASGPQYTKTISGSFLNSGITTWGPLGNLDVNGALINMSNGVFEVLNDNSSMRNFSGTGLIVNDGVIRKTGGTLNINCYMSIFNNGTIDTQSGTLTLLKGSEINDGCAFTGAGMTRLTGETNTMSGSIHSENLHLLYSATLEGTGTVSGTIYWGGGTVGPNAVISVATNGHLAIGSTFQFGKTLRGDLINAGNITIESLGNFEVGGTLHNLSGGVVDVLSDNISIVGLGSDASILNDGLFRKSGGTIGNNCYVGVTNNGVLQIQTGKLYFPSGFANPGGSILLEGGSFQSSGTLCLQGGGLAGWGTIYNTVTNSATVRPSRTNGVLAITGDYVQTLAGTTVFELGGNQPGVNQARLNITGNATLSGFIDMELAHGYLPEPGTNFTVMAFASHTGEFDFKNGFVLLGHARRLELGSTATSLTLETVSAPDPTEVSLEISAGEDSIMVAWPLEFSGYGLYCKTNLYQPEWILVPGITNRFIEPPPLPPMKFFRLIKP